MRAGSRSVEIGTKESLEYFVVFGTKMIRVGGVRITV